MWRLQTHDTFGGTWLSDYVPNRLGGFHSVRQENPRPLCPLMGQDGNIFHLMGIAARVLRQNGMAAEAKEMQTRIMGGACHSYEEALGIISEYVEIEDAPMMVKEEPRRFDIRLCDHGLFPLRDRASPGPNAAQRPGV